MGNWSLTGTLLLILVFFTVFGFLLTEINIPVPANMTADNITQISVFQTIVNWIAPW